MTPSTHEALVRAREALAPLAAVYTTPLGSEPVPFDLKFKDYAEVVRLIDAALLLDPKAAQVSVTALAEEFIAQGAAMENVIYDADTRQRMLASFNAGFNAGRRAPDPKADGAGAEATIAELRKGWRDDERQYERRLAELTARLAEAEKRLRPFAEEARKLGERDYGVHNAPIQVFRDAASYFAASPSQGQPTQHDPIEPWLPNGRTGKPVPPLASPAKASGDRE